MLGKEFPSNQFDLLIDFFSLLKVKFLIILILLTSLNARDFAFYLDNDGFTGTDVEYSSGVRMAWSWSNQDSRKEFRGFSINHEIYTPPSHWLTNPPLDERPYAAWLGLGYSHGVTSFNHRRIFEYSLGVTGDASLGEPLQEIAHTFESYDGHQGWDSQVPTELTLNLFYSENWKISHFKTFIGHTDLWIGTSGKLGNYLTSGGISANYRIALGNSNLGDLVPTRVENTGYAYQEQRSTGFSLNFKSSINCILHSIALGDQFYRNGYETNINKEPFIFENSVSLTYSRESYEISASLVNRSKDYEEQESAHNYGNLSFIYHF